MKKVIIASLFVSALGFSAAYAANQNQVKLIADATAYKSDIVSFSVSTQQGLVGLGSLSAQNFTETIPTPESLKGGYNVQVGVATAADETPKTFCSKDPYDFNSAITIINFDADNGGFRPGAC